MASDRWFTQGVPQPSRYPRNAPMIQGLSHDHQRTYNEIFQHPISGNLERGAVRSMFEALGNVTEEHNGNLKVHRNGHMLVLHPIHSKHPAENDEVMRIRHFLEESASE